jgi:hypothetical protein
MERTEFTGVDGQSWWLYEVQTEIRIEEARRELGATLGWYESDWFTDPNRRQSLFDFLQTNGAQLLIDLDTLADSDARLQWVLQVKKLAAPPPRAAEDGQPPGAANSRQAVQPDPPATPVAAPARKSAFKAKAGSDEESGQPEQNAAPAAAARKSIFKARAAPDAAAAAPRTPQLEEATKTVLSDLSGGGLADLAQELGVEPGDLEGIVNNPDFERQVREEVARMVSS